jgi:hypothetical protein
MMAALRLSIRWVGAGGILAFVLRKCLGRATRRSADWSDQPATRFRRLEVWQS